MKMPHWWKSHVTADMHVINRNDTNFVSVVDSFLGCPIKGVEKTPKDQYVYIKGSI